MAERGAEDGGAEAELGPAPAVAGRDRIRALVRERLFDAAPVDDRDRGEGAAATPPSLGAQDTEVAEGGSPSTQDQVPERIGRFRVLEQLGRGGMGVVYAAYDPELDRKVALKLVRPELGRLGDGTAGHARLLREAQAMARLSHVNVITVHEVGTLDDRVYVAMELVDGESLRAWLDAEARRWQDALSVCVAAGAGLAAAHRAGLVHRDFKPDNVMIGRDGRVRVMDFGLARTLGEDDEARPEGSISSASGRDPLATPLTRTGAVMGTPAYMSPEQFLGRPTDARSDQFSFCVATWEALCGHRPFRGRDFGELAAAVAAGRIRDAPVRVPRRVIGALRRGLQPEPALRWPDMDALLAALGRDPMRRVRRAALVVGFAGAASAVAVAFAQQGVVDVDRCAGEEQALAGVWDDDRRAAVRAALLATATPFAARVQATTETLLDEYAREWIDLAEETCAAELVARKDGPDGGRRRACLETRRAELGHIVEMLATADAGVAMQAVDAVARMSDIGACADARRLEPWRAPADAAAREALAAARAKVGVATARGALGKHDEAIALAQEVVDEAHRLDDPATEAAGLLVRGHYEERKGDEERAERTLRDAVSRAEMARDHGTRAHALIELVYVVGTAQARYDEAKAFAAEARAVLELIGADRLMVAHLDANLGTAAKAAGELEVAREHHERALATWLEVYGEAHPTTARSLTNLGTTLSAMDRWEDAVGYQRRALASFEDVLGPDHPLVASAVGNLGNTYSRWRPVARHDEAVPLQRRAVAIREKNAGPDSPQLAPSLFNLAMALCGSGRHDEALGHFRRGLELKTREKGAEHESLVEWWLRIGVCELTAGRPEQASPSLDRALALLDDGSAGRRARIGVWLALALVRSDRARAKLLLEGARARLDEEVAEATLPEDKDDAQRVLAIARTTTALLASLDAIE
jgi:tetratricopeptide (TPR) repeat protein